MKVWPIDPLVPRNLRLEVPEKLPQGLIISVCLSVSLFSVGMSRRKVSESPGATEYGRAMFASVL